MHLIRHWCDRRPELDWEILWLQYCVLLPCISPSYIWLWNKLWNKSKRFLCIQLHCKLLVSPIYQLIIYDILKITMPHRVPFVQGIKELCMFSPHIEGLVRNCSSSSALALELLQSCTRRSIAWCGIPDRCSCMCLFSYRYKGVYMIYVNAYMYPWVQYIPRNMHTVFALLCFVVVIHWLIFPYLSGLLHWHRGNLTIAPVPAKQPWWIWINTSCEFIMNDCITTTKQSTTKPCAYFLGYTVCAWKMCICTYSTYLKYIYICICKIVLIYAYVYTEIILRYAHKYAYIYMRMF